MQLRAFTQAADRANRRERLDRISDMRVAAKFESKDFTSYTTKLENG